MRALIFEPQFAGHNLVYVRHIAQALLHLGVEVHLLTSRQAVESEEFGKHLGEISHALSITASDLFSNSSKASGVRVNGPGGLFASMRSLLGELKTARPDHFYLPFGNPLAHALGIPNPVSRSLRQQGIESEIVLLFGKYAYNHSDLSSKAKQQVALQLLANGPWTRIHHIVPHAVEVMHRHSSRLRGMAHLLADPVDPAPSMTKSQAKAMLGLDPAAKYISLIGLIDKRKGVHDLLAAAKELATQSDSPAKILLAGKNSLEARELLAAEYGDLVLSGRVVVFDRHLSPSELWAACIASDVVTTPYPNHQYSASLLIRAASVGVPVLANAIGWMQDVTERFGLGWVCDTRNPIEFAQMLRTITEGAQEYSVDDRSKRFVEFHSLSNFQSQITERIVQRLASRTSTTHLG
ncbi:MAG: glycosyltransferase [Planctomycetota bacterium]|nr:glycosyltransferase [Planctomycetota bacterium]